MSVKTKTNNEIIQELGARVRSCRLQRNLSQDELARQAGVNRTTVRDVEGGKDSQLSTLVKLMRVLGRLEDLDAFLPVPSISPIQLMKLQGKKSRQRARRSSDG